MEQILRLFSIRIRECFLQANIFEMFAGELEEIRVRVNQPIELVTARGEYFLKNDTLVSFPDRQCLSVTAEDLRQMSTLMSQYSLYAYEEEVRQGFLTVEGGHRIGVCGQVTQKAGTIGRIYPILYLNIRIARERKDAEKRCTSSYGSMGNRKIRLCYLHRELEKQRFYGI